MAFRSGCISPPDNFLVVSGYYFVLIYDIITYLNTIIYKHIFNIIYFAPSL